MTVQKKNPHIGRIASLQRKPNKDDALALLEDTAHRVSYLMRENKFKVGELVEFYPRDKRLLGMNVNGGAKIMLRLRHPNDESQFLARESILGTMLHELTHNLFGPHDAKFYRKLDELSGTQWVIEQRGLFDSFVGRGRRLGCTPRSRIPPTERRLGTIDVVSSNNRDKSPRRMAAAAAEKRARDTMWCGDSKRNKHVEPDAAELEYIILDDEDKDQAHENGNSPILVVDLLNAHRDHNSCDRRRQGSGTPEIIDLT